MRIPAYQAVIGAAALFLVTFIGLDQRISTDAGGHTPQGAAVLADTTMVPLYEVTPEADLQDSLQTRRSVWGDSLVSTYYRGMFDTLGVEPRIRRL
jgi:hypothetical protein